MKIVLSEEMEKHLLKMAKESAKESGFTLIEHTNLTVMHHILETSLRNKFLYIIASIHSCLLIYLLFFR